MDLSTKYLGLTLNTPLIVGASPLADDTEVARRLQDAGAAAIVMRSLFEEQIYLDELARGGSGKPEAAKASPEKAYFPTASEYRLTPDRYLRQIENLKGSLSIPIIASLNGCRSGGWIDYGRRFENAGADAIELNLYHLSADPAVSGAVIEAEMLEAIRSLAGSVRCPVAVKLSVFHTAPAHFVSKAEEAGAAGVVVFNRFYQPGLDIQELQSDPRLTLSDSAELLVRLHWIAILSAHMRGSIAATGGIEGTADAIKAILAGANAVHLVSAVLKHGPRFLSSLLDGIRKWMEEHRCGKIDDFRGSLNLRNCADATALERANYQRLLQTWRV